MSKGTPMNRRDEVEALLPFYLNGTLTDADLKLVEDWLANDPAAAEALAEANAELEFFSEENEKLRPSPDAFKRFSDALEKEAGPAVSPVSWFASFMRKTFTIPAPLIWAGAAAALVAIVFTANISDRSRLNDIEVAGAGDATNVPFVLVSFKPDAKMSDIAALLLSANAQIGEGPASGGIYKIILSATDVTDYDLRAAALSASPLVDQVIPGRKPDAAEK
jgi:anti-sigma-K factor RskA